MPTLPRNTAFKEWVQYVPGGQWGLLGLVFAGLVLLDALLFGVTRIIDQRGGDVLLALAARTRPVSDRVVIVDIDQRSLENMNDMAGSWPWPRSVHGELIDYLAKQGPRAIAFDILFNEADIYRPEHDAAFADAVARHSNVWLAMTLNSDGEGAHISQMPAAAGIRPAPGANLAALRAADIRVPLLLPLVVASHPEAMRGGLINFTPDSDNVGRHYGLFGERGGWRFPSLPLRVMEANGQLLPPADRILLNWRAGWKHVSYSDLYLDSLREHRQRPADEFKGKIVLIGTSAPGLLDLRLTPLGSTYPGVEILATAFDNLDRGDWLREVPRRWLVPLSLLLVGLVSFAFIRNISANRTGYGLAGVTVAVILCAWAGLLAGWFVPVLAPLAFGWASYLAASGLAYLQERSQRLRTATMFKRFLDPQIVADLIGKQEVDYRNSARTAEISVLFSDIRGFTSLSEITPAEDVVALLNAYFSRQVGVIFRHSGTLDKFIGDCIMAFWGAPVALEPAQSARLAVATAMEMSAALDEMRGRLGDLGRDLEVGIGIHTGKAVVGFIGSNDRLDYTVIGDTVNLASRVEGLTKGIARVLVTQATRDAVGSLYDWRDCGLHKVKGREEPVQLFEPMAKSAMADG